VQWHRCSIDVGLPCLLRGNAVAHDPLPLPWR
jgi:hypothetical protein